VRGDLGVGVQGKPLHAGTVGTRQCGALTLMAKLRADALDLLSSPFPKGNALLHRSDHRAGEFGFVIAQGVIACRHHGVETRFEVPQMA
jgi:hypothetical protein